MKVLPVIVSLRGGAVAEPRWQQAEHYWTRASRDIAGKVDVIDKKKE